MPDYAALKAWLDLPEHAGLSDADAAEAYNAARVTVLDPVISSEELVNWAARSGVRSRIRAAAESVDDQVASIALAVEDRIRGSHALDTSKPSNMQMLGMLVQKGVMTAAQRDDLLALTSRTAPLYAQPGQFGVPATEHDVAHARSL